ncbi:TnsA endonuclease N-terminal domain-containing protein [Uliginosibacterium paludis]|uniref:TnsA endonuclease N-terminal domain-containing protein n=1 Tax=Uliginosibacterium paludis TaxID=1615952 RepID=A0ABV2CTD3_9RHOO
MRTTKRFTPTVLARFVRQGRGQGIHADYSAWHQVTRGDPSSRGRSHIVTLHGRSHDFLSDLERNTALQAWMHPDHHDLREQHPLSLTTAPHELVAYRAAPPYRLYPGTLDLARKLGIRHPILRFQGEQAPWVMTTDQLVTLKSADGKLRLMALSCKYASDTNTPRRRQLLALEREYWRVRGVPCRLITEKLLLSRVTETLVRTWHWGLISSPPPDHLEAAMWFARHLQGMPLHSILAPLRERFNSMTAAQEAFWRAVWLGRIPMRLTVGWRPTERVDLLPKEVFWAQNSVVSGGDAWTN